METPTNIVRLRQPEDLDDPLTEVLRALYAEITGERAEVPEDTPWQP